MEGRLQAAGRPFQTAPQGPLFRSLSAKKRVGKTSIANIFYRDLNTELRPVLAVRVNCDTFDDFPSLWRKVFRRIKYDMNGSEEWADQRYRFSDRVCAPWLTQPRPVITAEDGCRFNWLYIRVMPSHEIQLAATSGEFSPAAPTASRVPSTSGNWRR